MITTHVASIIHINQFLNFPFEKSFRWETKIPIITFSHPLINNKFVKVIKVNFSVFFHGTDYSSLSLISCKSLQKKNIHCYNVDVAVSWTQQRIISIKKHPSALSLQYNILSFGWLKDAYVPKTLKDSKSNLIVEVTFQLRTTKACWVSIAIRSPINGRVGEVPIMWDPNFLWNILFKMFFGSALKCSFII